MAPSLTKQDFESNLYKAFLDDATLPDVTIHLSDRAVRVHKIVLCRQSEYFTKLLTGQFQESGANDIVLHEDDPEAMVALLRYTYGLPYDEFLGHPREQLRTHAEYQVQGLKLAICNNMRRTLHTHLHLGMAYAKPEIADFINALQIVVAGTPAGDDYARKVMLEACVWNLRSLHQHPESLALLRQSADLGAEIIGHQDLECGLAGDWVYGGNCKCRLTVECSECYTDLKISVR